MKAQEIVDKISDHAEQLKVNESLRQASIPKIHTSWPVVWKKETMKLEDMRKR